MPVLLLSSSLPRAPRLGGEPEDKRTGGPEEKRTRGPEEKRRKGPEDRRTRAGTEGPEPEDLPGGGRWRSGRTVEDVDVWMRRVVVAVVGGCARIVSLCLICVAMTWLVVMLLRVRERGSLVPLHLCLVSVVHHVVCAAVR